MKKLSLLLLLATFLCYGCSSDDEKNTFVISLEDKLTVAESEFTTTDGVLDDPIYNYYMKSVFKDSKGLIEFIHYYSEAGFGGGFTYTNKSDVSTPGNGNISAITGKGKDHKVYLTINTFMPSKMYNPMNHAFCTKGVWVTNSTYAYCTIKDGVTGTSMEARKFVSGDWFKITAIGFDASNKEIGRTECYLADFRDGKSEIVNTWKWFDLEAIGEASCIQFELSSTDNGEWGMNTPAYFCMDGITLVQR